MVCRRRRTLLYISLVSLASLCVCVFLMSRLPQELQPSLMLEREIAAAGREAIMNGKRDILNVEQNVPVVVAKVELKGDM